MRYKTRLLRYFATIIGILAFSLLGTTKNLFAASISSFGVSPSTVNLELSPSIGSSSSSTGSHTATITTDCASGYKIYVSMAKPSGSDEVDNYLHLNGSTEESILGSNAIGPTSGSISSPAALSTNSWGVKVGDSNTFGAVPTYSEIKRYSNEISANPPALISSSTPAATGQDHIVTYGANATTDLVAGYYQGAILYTTIMDSACYTSTITIEKDDHVASTSGITSGNSYPVGSAQSVTCTPETGYSCTWYIGDTKVSEDDTYSFTVPNHNLTLTAKSTLNSYTLTLINGNGPAITEITGGGSKPYGSTVTVTCTARTGYHCTGWTSSDSSVPDSTEANYTFTMPAKDITLTADGTDNKYNIVLQANGSGAGGGTFSNVSYFSRIDFNDKGPFGKPGYTMLGWSHSSDATTATYATSRWDTVSEIVDNAGQTNNHGATINLYAVSRPNTYTINVDLNGGSGCMVPTYENVKYDESIYVSPCLRDGYEFMGLAHQSTATEPDYIHDYMTPVSTIVDAVFKQNDDGATIQLYAVWTRNANLVRTEDEYGLNIKVSRSTTCTSSSTCKTSIYATPGANVYIFKQNDNPGYDFIDWVVETDSGSLVPVYEDVMDRSYFVMPEEDVTVSAEMRAHAFSVYFNGCNNTSGSMNPQTFTYGTYRALSLNAFSRTNYEFVGWNKTGCKIASQTPENHYVDIANGADGSTLTTADPGIVDLYAVWRPIAYAYDDIDDDDLLDIYITTQSSYNNGTWDATGGAASLAFMAGEKVYIKAGWIQNEYEVSSWLVEGQVSGTNYDVSEISEIEASFTMPNEPVLISGNATVKKYAVTINKGSHITSTTGAGSYASSTRVNISATAETGYHFKSWTVNSGGASLASTTSSSTNFRMPNNTVTLTANAEANTYYVQFNGCENTGGSMSNQTFTYGNAQNLTANAFTRSGYVFKGWSSSSCSATTTNYSNGQSVNNLTAVSGNTFKLYAIWRNATITDVSTLQQVTSTVCNNSQIGEETTLRDARDTNSYRVAKLEDGYCWMLDPLKLKGVTLYSNTSNINYTIDGAFTLPSTFADDEQFTENNGAKLPLIYEGSNGYLYNFYAATAGVGKNKADQGTVPDSICPYNWHIPGPGDYGVLITHYPTRAALEGTAGFASNGYIKPGQADYSVTIYWSNKSTSINGANTLLAREWGGNVSATDTHNKKDGIGVICAANTW